MATTEPTRSGSDDGRARFRISSQELERLAHIPVEDQVQSVTADQPPTWPDWQEQQRQSQLAGGGIA